MAAVKAKSSSSVVREHKKISRPGVHSKNKTSGLKTSKNYVKKYVGQGR